MSKSATDRAEFMVAIDSDVLHELVWALRYFARQNCLRPGWGRGGPTCRSKVKEERLDSARWCWPCNARQAVERYEREHKP